MKPLTLGTLVLAPDGTLRKVIGTSVSGLVVTVNAHDERKPPEFYVDDPADLVPVVPEPEPTAVETIAAARRMRGLTQRQLAAAANIGISHLSHLEQQKRMPSEDARVRLERVLGVQLRAV